MEEIKLRNINLMFIAHAPFSYVVNEGIQGKNIKKLKFSKEVIVAFWSLFCGILPDFDFLVLLAFRRPSFSHHDLITHTPVFWIGIYFLVLILYKIFFRFFNKKTKEFLDGKFFKILANTLLIGTLSHLLADLLVGGIMVLYPFSTNDFSLLQTFFPINYFTGYYLSFYLAIEILIVAVFLVVFSRKFMQKQKWDEPIAYILLGLSVIYLIFTIGMYTQTYNNGLRYDENNDVCEDLDYDGIKDIYDYDVNDNDTNNIDEAVSSHLASSAENIVKTGGITVALINMTAEQKILYKYGAFNSYRIISQAYFENDLPIEPVLEKEVKNRLEVSTYSIEYEEVDELYTYFRNREELSVTDINSLRKSEEGKIFFLLDEDLEVINLGMVLTDGNVAIVFDEDTKLQNHTSEEIAEEYDMESVLIQIQE